MNQNVPAPVNIQRFERKVGNLITIVILTSPSLQNEHERVAKEVIRDELGWGTFDAREKGILIISEDNPHITEEMFHPHENYPGSAANFNCEDKNGVRSHLHTYYYYQRTRQIKIRPS